MNKPKHIQVAAAVIKNHSGQIFITQRHEGSHLAGLWEFPGGKVELNETPFEALQRELFEEVDIIIHQASLITTIEHIYPTRTITLSVYLVDEWDGVPFSAEGQRSRWVQISSLNADEFPEANRTIIEYLKEQN